MPFMYIYQMSDFVVTGGNILPPNEQGALAQGSPPFCIMLKANAVPILIEVDDVDANPTELGELGNGQTLADPITINDASGNPVTYGAGTTIRGNYFLTDDANDPGLELASITLGQNNTGGNTTHAVAFFGQPVPGQQYKFETELNYNGNQRPYEEFLICFAAGTCIDTAEGPVPVEELRQGDLVLTRDRGVQPIRWIGGRTLTPTPAQCPVEFATGAVGNHAPLRVSPQHRMLISDWRAQIFFAEDIVLAPAKALINDDTIRQVPVDEVTYYHVMFDQHDIIRANGAWTESLLYTDHTRHALSHDQREEIETLFPELMMQAMPLARVDVRVSEGPVL